MGLIRLLILIILLALLYRFWRQWRAGKTSKSKQPVDQGKMVACKHCGLYLPERDALRDGDTFYCSEAHRRADRG